MPEAVHPKINDDGRNPGAVALSIAAMMRVFGNGEMAALRRLDDNSAVPAYWRLAARQPILSERNNEERCRAWRAIVQALAILTPKGPPGERGDLHDPERKLGEALCDGGRPDWPGGLSHGTSPRPMISEQRLAQLLAARGSQRSVLLLRAVRALAASRDVAVGVDVGDLAWRFIDPDPGKLAAFYYARLDRAERAAKADPTKRTSDA